MEGKDTLKALLKPWLAARRAELLATGGSASRSSVPAHEVA